MPKIPALPPMTSPDAADELPIEDVSVSTTKYITLTKLKEWFQSLSKWLGRTNIDFSTFASRQLDTTNSTPDQIRVQYGIGKITGGGANEIAETVTFPTAFSATPIVVANAIGFIGTSGAFNPAGIDGSWAGQTANANAPTASSFTLMMRRNDGSTYGTGSDYYYSWIAIGPA